MFFFSFQAQLNLRTVNTRNIKCHGFEFQTEVSRFLHSSFRELRLKKQNDLLYKSNVPDYFLLVEDFPSDVPSYLAISILVTRTALHFAGIQFTHSFL